MKSKHASFFFYKFIIHAFKIEYTYIYYTIHSNKSYIYIYLKIYKKK